ncbi:hypothetical protein CAPTEDRAFT_189448 [Capitella teleta]|uniref:Cyclic nucleotide-binding domain-containing protein n=1 Tax=Capitella teleta TaxID=283909 RepID=R7V1E3_CAPTE|nr:hypothetical protein CAPTEDRAFT_189448 [Capitella teleta]|eukprot:ELU12307.1 hypothetical protein CAPTEDRAFT_189448 [Capitella teleta]
MERREGRPIEILPKMVVKTTNHFIKPSKEKRHVAKDFELPPPVRPKSAFAQQPSEGEQRKAHDQRLQKLRRSLREMGTGARMMRARQRLRKQGIELPSPLGSTEKLEEGEGDSPSSFPLLVCGFSDTNGNGDSIPKKRNSMAYIRNLGGKSFFRSFKKIAKFCCIFMGLWRKHVMKVHEFMQKNIQLVNVHLISDVLFDVTDFKVDQQVEIALRNYPEIAAYPVGIQARIAERCWYERFVGRRIIIRQGHCARCFYFILSGAVLVTRMGDNSDMSRTICYLHRGDSFGELAILSKGTRDATCISQGNLELLVCSDEEYEGLFMTGRISDKNSLRQVVVFKVFSASWSISCLHGWPGSCTVLKKLHSIEASTLPKFARNAISAKQKQRLVEMSPEDIEVSLTNRVQEMDKQRTRNGIQMIKDLRMGTLGHLFSAKRVPRDRGTHKGHDHLPKTDIKKNLVTVLDSGLVDKKPRSSNRKKSVTIWDPSKKAHFPRSKSDLGPDTGLADMLHEDQPSLSLVSNGAECLLIDKQFYFNHMPQNLWQRLRLEVGSNKQSFIQRCRIVIQRKLESMNNIVTQYGSDRDNWILREEVLYSNRPRNHIYCQ